MLRELFGPGLDAERIITSRGGGVAVSSDAFGLHLLGHRNAVVYDGSFIEWSAGVDAWSVRLWSARRSSRFELCGVGVARKLMGGRARVRLQEVDVQALDAARLESLIGVERMARRASCAYLV